MIKHSGNGDHTVTFGKTKSVINETGSHFLDEFYLQKSTNEDSETNSETAKRIIGKHIMCLKLS
jgi:hypothetical protein